MRIIINCNKCKQDNHIVNIENIIHTENFRRIKCNYCDNELFVLIEDEYKITKGVV